MTRKTLVLVGVWADVDEDGKLIRYEPVTNDEVQEMLTEELCREAMRWWQNTDEAKAQRDGEAFISDPVEIPRWTKPPEPKKPNKKPTKPKKAK